MDWQVVFYQDAGGDEPVADFIRRQPDSAIAEITHVIELLCQFNISLGMPYVKKIGRTSLRELRIKHGSDIYRIFFFAHTGRKLVLLHAIKKKQDKTPQNAIDLAVRRMDELKDGH